MADRRPPLVLWVALFGVVAIGCNTALACSCPHPNPHEAFDRADFVVQAVVTCRTVPRPYPSVTNGDTMMVISSADMVLYTIRVSKVWKGSAEVVDQVYSARDGAFCGYHFEVGSEYVIFGNVDDFSTRGWVWACEPEFPVTLTGLCAGTQEVGQAQEALEILGQPEFVFGDRQERE